MELAVWLIPVVVLLFAYTSAYSRYHRLGRRRS